MADSIGQDHSAHPVTVGGMAVWLAVQMAALLLSAWRVPLSDQFVRPAERAAVDTMLLAQFCAIAALFPIILPGLWSAIAAAASSWPFAHLAAVLASRPVINLVQSWLYLCVWIALLATWRHILRHSSRGLLIGAALATCAALGGPILCYLRAEFALPAGTGDAPDLAGPAMAAIAMLGAKGVSAGPWAWLGGALAATAVFQAVAFLIARRRLKASVRSDAVPGG